MSASREFTHDAARDAILGYLAECPQAMETFHGIADWWIARYWIRVDVETLWQVVQDLTRTGVLEEVGGGAEVRYRLKTRATTPGQREAP